jgi:hypothetical protein
MKTPADLWAMDKVPAKNLPLNYAVMMQHWGVAERLIADMTSDLSQGQGLNLRALQSKDMTKEMAEEQVMGICNRIARACAVVIDSGEQCLKMLVPLAELWRKAGGDEQFGLSPLGYAFQARAAWALMAFLESGHANLWAVDESLRLPIERALQVGMADVVLAIAEKMKSSRPVRPSHEAAWSLVRCKGASISGSSIPGLQELAVLADEKVGRRIFTCGDMCLNEYDALSLKQFGSVPLEEKCTCLAVSCQRKTWSEDEPIIVYAGTVYGSIYRFQMRDGFKPLETLKAHKQAITCLQLWNSSILHSASNDNTVKVWNFTDHSQNATCVLTLPFATDVNACVRVDDCLFAASRATIYRFDVSSRALSKGRPSPAEMKGHSGTVEVLLFQRRRLFSGGRKGEIRLWNKDGSANNTWKGHDSGKRVIGLSADKANIHVFSIAVRNVDSTGVGDESMHVRMRRGNCYSGPSEVRAWSIEGELLSTWSNGHFDACLCGDIWSLKGVVVTATVNGLVEVWNGDTGVKLADVQTHALLTAVAVTGPSRGETQDENENAAGQSMGTDSASLVRELMGQDDREGSESFTTRPMLLRTNRETLKSAFNYHDKDRNGRLSKDELRCMLRKGDSTGSISDEIADLLMDYVDEDHDGTISFDEFVDFIHSAPYRPFDGSLGSPKSCPVRPITAPHAAARTRSVMFDGRGVAESKRGRGHAARQRLADPSPRPRAESTASPQPLRDRTRTSP